MIEAIVEALVEWIVRALKSVILVALSLSLMVGCATARSESEEEEKYREFMSSFSSQEAPPEAKPRGKEAGAPESYPVGSAPWEVAPPSASAEPESEPDGSGNAEAIRLLSVAQANCSEVITCFALFSASGGKFPTEDSARRCEAARQVCDAGLALAEKIRSLPGGDHE